MENAHAYCDESGNTGANLLDFNQPLLIVGGWLVECARPEYGIFFQWLMTVIFGSRKPEVRVDVR